MIYTITLNPSLDYVVELQNFELGKLHRTKEEYLYVGGKGINVSSVLKQLDMESIALGFVAGFTGEEIIKRLECLGISTDFVILNQGMSRINIKMKSTGSVESEINGQGPYIKPEDLNKLYDKFDCIKNNDILVLSGSVPQNIIEHSTIYSQICECLSGRNVKFIIDAEGKLLRNTLSYRPFLIKPNHHELEKLFQQEIRKEEDIITCAMRLRDMGAQNVLVSLAERGAILINEFGQVIRQTALKGEVKNSVGAGDSMIAGFLAGLYKDKQKETFHTEDYKLALEISVATGSAAAFSYDLPNKEMIEKMINEIKS